MCVTDGVGVMLSFLRFMAGMCGLMLCFSAAWRYMRLEQAATVWAGEAIAGSVLIIAVFCALQDSTRRRALFASAWSAALFAGFGGLMQDILTPEFLATRAIAVEPFEFLVMSIFALALSGTLLTILMPRSSPYFQGKQAL